MGLLKKKNQVVFTLLLTGLVLNILWSLRLESTAQELGAKVIEHHGMLSQNKDILSALDAFLRTVPPYFMSMDSKGITLKTGTRSITMDLDSFNYNDGKNQVGIDDEGISMHTGEDFHFALDAKTKSASIYTSNSKINVERRETGEYVELKIGEDSTITLSKDDVYIKQESLDFGMHKTAGIVFQARPQEGDALNFSMDPVLKDIQMNIGGEDFCVKLDSNKQQIEVKKGESVVRVGKGAFGEGVELGEFGTGTIAINKGKGAAVAVKKHPFLIRGLESASLKMDFDGDIEIKAKGNINICSEQGDVKINGKRVSLNE